MEVLAVDRLGPQYPGDDDFTARMRKHQSWWRSDRLRVGWGTDQKGKPYGNYLLESDAAAGLNFLRPSIYRCARGRIVSGRGVEPFRCLRNLLSSQPMAFNLFGPLCADRVLAARLLDPLLPGGVSDAAVFVEWAPEPAVQYLADATSFDVAVRYKTRSGERAIAGIETKLTEPFSPKSYGLNDHRTATYRRIAGKSAVWSDPMDDRLTDRRWNQVWRNHLLVESIRQQEQGLRGCQVIVHHEEDHRCAKNVSQYRDFLVEPDQTFRCLTLGKLVTTWRQLLSGMHHLRWLDDFEDRYLNLSLSEGCA
jgi:hypothetical protein